MSFGHCAPILTLVHLVTLTANELTRLPGLPAWTAGAEASTSSRAAAAAAGRISLGIVSIALLGAALWPWPQPRLGLARLPAALAPRFRCAGAELRGFDGLRPGRCPRVPSALYPTRRSRSRFWSLLLDLADNRRPLSVGAAGAACRHAVVSRAPN